ncbi:MAG TPA: hypothetical protein VFB30_20535, partial [Spirochaetia bacterium]|nr:hypothetical protein [Spirochaetia bacterium]
MELIRYLLNNILKRPMRAGFIIAAGALSAAVLVFAFALGARTTAHVRADTIAKWTGHLWVSRKDGFEFKPENIDSYTRQARAVRDYLSGHPNTAALIPWATSGCEIQAGTARTYLRLTATDFQADEPYRKSTELVAGRFPGLEDEYGVLVTTVLAAKYKLKTGDSITLFIPSVYGARNAMDFIITGIDRASAPWYEDGIAIRIQDYLSMTELGDASPFYKAYVKDERGIPAMVKELSARMNGAKYGAARSGAEYGTTVADFPVQGYQDDKFVRFLLNLGTSNVLMFGFMAMIIFLALLIGIRSIILT